MMETANLLFHVARGHFNMRWPIDSKFTETVMRNLVCFFTLALMTVAFSVHAQAGGGKSDKDLLQGTWDLATVAFQGKDVGGKSVSLTFKGDKIFSKEGDKAEKEEGYKIDSTKKPKEIDIMPEGKLVRAIYELKDDTFRICFGFNTEERPADFAKGDIIMTFKKKK